METYTNISSLPNPKQPPNPTNEQRYILLKEALLTVNRQEDLTNIINILKPPIDIKKIAAPGSLKEIKVGVIGGGMAGMAAAFELRKLGCNITIFEAESDRIGGRVYTHYFDEDKKNYGELGALRIPVSHETTWHYINLLKVDTEPFVQNNPMGFVYVLNTRTRNNPKEIQEKIYPKFNLTPKERNTPWRTLYNYAFNSPISNLPPHVRTEILRILPTYNPDYVPLLNISLRENFELLGLSDEAIDLILSVDSFSGSLTDIGFSHFLSQNYPVNLAYLYRISGGSSNLAVAFCKSLNSSSPKEYDNDLKDSLGEVKWKRGFWVSGIYKNEGGDRVIIKYKNEKMKKYEKEQFDYVICAIPFSTLRTVEIDPVFSNRKMQAIRELNYINGQRTLFLCNKRFWEEDTDYGRINGGISYTDLAITNIIYPSDHIYKGNPNEAGVLIASYNLHRDATNLGNSNPDIREYIIKRQVETVHGLKEGYLDNIVRKTKFFNWDDNPWAKGAVVNLTPEQKRIFSHEILKSEYNDRIFFAGEHASATNAWIQGALHSGMLAANKLAKVAHNRI